MVHPFLSARWKNRPGPAHAPPARPEPYCPDGVELEHADGRSLVSPVTGHETGIESMATDVPLDGFPIYR